MTNLKCRKCGARMVGSAPRTRDGLCRSCYSKHAGSGSRSGVKAQAARYTPMTDVKCKECGVNIHPSGSKETDGLCLPCYQFSCQYGDLSNSGQRDKSKVECVKCGQLASRKYAYYRWGLCPKCVEGKENLKTAVGLIGVGGLCVLALIMVVWYFSTVDSSHESTDYETLRKERLIREEKGRLEKERMEQREAIERAIIREKLRREGY